MTTIAMAAGMMPSALAFGAGGEFRSPMALAVIGGLVFSTVLSLVFVPAMFMMMDDLGALIWRFGQKLLVSPRRTRASAVGPSQRAPGRKARPRPKARRRCRPRRNNRNGTACFGDAFPSLVPCHRGQLGHILQQDAAALQVQNAILAPELQLTVDAFARRADEDTELLLRDVDFRSEIRRQRTQPSRQANRQRVAARIPPCARSASGCAGTAA